MCPWMIVLSSESVSAPRSSNRSCCRARATRSRTPDFAQRLSRSHIVCQCRTCAVDRARCSPGSRRRAKSQSPDDAESWIDCYVTAATSRRRLTVRRSASSDASSSCQGRAADQPRPAPHPGQCEQALDIQLEPQLEGSRFCPVWWAGLDSNQRPSGYEPPALTPELPAPVLWDSWAVYPSAHLRSEHELACHLRRADRIGGAGCVGLRSVGRSGH